MAKGSTHVRYELFADMEGADSDAESVERTKVAQAFPAVGAKRERGSRKHDTREFSRPLAKLHHSIRISTRTCKAPQAADRS